MKECKKCLIPKELTDFRKNKKKVDGLNIYCNSCQRQLDKECYNRNIVHNQEDGLRRKKEYRERNNKFIIDYLNIHPCVDCGERDIIVLEFDHIRDKKYEISKIIQNCSVDRLEKEIEKCEVRCANCHRRKTAKNRKYYRIVE